MRGRAEDTLEPLRAGLVPVPATPQVGVCEVCHSASDPSFSQCYPCLQAAQRVGVWEVLPISMSVHGGLMHQHLRGYKDFDAHSGALLTRRLAALTAIFLRRHAACVGRYDSVVVVPSARRVAVEPIIRQVRSFAEALAPALDAEPVAGRPLAADRFHVTRDVRGERTLVFDDTFTSGASLFSACAALRDAGAVVVGPLVIGRHLRPDHEPSTTLLNWLGRREWDETRCCRCAGERRDPGALL